MIYSSNFAPTLGAPTGGGEKNMAPPYIYFCLRPCPVNKFIFPGHDYEG